jgi:hypothetical protein
MQLYSFPAGCSPNFQKRVSVGLGCGFVALPQLPVFKIKKKSKAFLEAMLLVLRLVSFSNKIRECPNYYDPKETPAPLFRILSTSHYFKNSQRKSCASSCFAKYCLSRIISGRQSLRPSTSIKGNDFCIIGVFMRWPDKQRSICLSLIFLFLFPSREKEKKD